MLDEIVSQGVTKAQEHRRKLERYQRAKAENNIETLDEYEARYQAYVDYYKAASRARGFFAVEGISLPFKGNGPEADAIHGDLTVIEIEAMTQSVNDTYSRIRRECDARFEAFEAKQKRQEHFSQKSQMAARHVRTAIRAREHHVTQHTQGDSIAKTENGGGSNNNSGDPDSSDPDPPRPGVRAHCPSSVTFHPKGNKHRYLNRRLSRRSWRVSRNTYGTQRKGR